MEGGRGRRAALSERKRLKTLKAVETLLDQEKGSLSPSKSGFCGN